MSIVLRSGRTPSAVKPPAGPTYDGAWSPRNRGPGSVLVVLTVALLASVGLTRAWTTLPLTIILATLMVARVALSLTVILLTLMIT